MSADIVIWNAGTVHASVKRRGLHAPTVSGGGDRGLLLGWGGCRLHRPRLGHGGGVSFPAVIGCSIAPPLWRGDSAGLGSFWCRCLLCGVRHLLALLADHR